MSFQWIIDRAETISMNRKAVVASTTARDGTVRAVSRGNQPWLFDVKLPDGMPWTEIRGLISQAEKLDKHTVGTFSFSNTGHDWLIKYQGNYSAPATFTGTWTQGSTSITVTGGGTASSGYRFRAGDIIQLGTGGGVYTVAADVAYNSTAVTLHRAVLQVSSSGTLKVGSACQWSVICTNFPQWTLFARNQVSWDGNFTFAENLV